jgi:hypothetical protein
MSSDLSFAASDALEHRYILCIERFDDVPRMGGNRHTLSATFVQMRRRRDFEEALKLRVFEKPTMVGEQSINRAIRVREKINLRAKEVVILNHIGLIENSIREFIEGGTLSKLKWIKPTAGNQVCSPPPG